VTIALYEAETVTIFINGRDVTKEFTFDAPAASRLSASCGDCGWSGSRNETFRASPRRGDTFIDKCPGCSSDNVDVYDPMHAEHDT